MILDTSAVVAIMYGEPEAALYTQLIHDADRCLISAGNFLELSMVIEAQLGPDVWPPLPSLPPGSSEWGTRRPRV